MRNKVFISHATPDDNEFTKWLALKLIGLGYEVWCDILTLDKGTDFWHTIETEIRENTIKFLIVSSRFSNQRDGVLKELAVATKVKKHIKDEKFIIPLAIDQELSYDDINIEIVRLNAIDFKNSWASGFKDLANALQKQNVPRDKPNPDRSNQLYQQIFLHDKVAIERDEIHDSNWFPIQAFPSELRFHNFNKLIPNKYDIRQLPYPAIQYKNYICTFAWEYDFIYQLPKTETYRSSETIRIPTDDILQGNYDSEFIRNSECQKLIIQLLNKAFEITMKTKEVSEYRMSNRLAYWIQKGKLEKDKFEKVLLVGKLKNKNWHFGISGAGKLYPFPVLMVSSHIFFTNDGINLIDSNSIQHSARRRQGKNWWNNAWRTKLLSFIKYLSDGNNTFLLTVGSEEKIQISIAPVQFIGHMSYNIPKENTLKEETELDLLNDTESEDEEMIENQVDE